MTRRSWRCALIVASVLPLVACASGSDTKTSLPVGSDLGPTSIPGTEATATTSEVTSTAESSTSTTSTTTSSTTSTVAVTASTAKTTTTTVIRPAVLETRVIGQSVQGRDITAYRMGTAGARPVLLVGVIHGDEAKGLGITQLIRTLPTPPGIDLWIIDAINPDGLAAGTRYNANGVDLNRNVSYKWSYIPRTATDGEYSGEAPADQPETKALEAFIAEIQPKITMFWHQDANRVSPGGARPEIPTKFAKIVGLTTASTPCTAGCTGTATQYINHAVKGGTAFIVELPDNDAVSPAMVKLQAEATLAVITL